MFKLDCGRLVCFYGGNDVRRLLAELTEDVNWRILWKCDNYVMDPLYILLINIATSFKQRAHKKL